MALESVSQFKVFDQVTSILRGFILCGGAKLNFAL